MEFSNQPISVATFVISDLTTTCRTCLVSNTNLLPLQETYIDCVPLTDILSLCGLRVNKGDLLPLNICVKCVDVLGTLHNFIKEALENERVLQVCFEPPEPQQCDTSTLDINKEKNNESSSERTIKKPNRTVKMCEVCGKCTNKLEEHMKVHNGNKPYQCKVCSRGFTQSDNLKRHMLRHTGDRPFLCYKCGWTFNQTSILKQHLKTHLPNHRPRRQPPLNLLYTRDSKDKLHCSSCSQIFDTMDTLKAHVKGHFAKVKFDCQVCHKVLRSKHALEVHAMIHTGERPFKCGHCDKAFRQRTGYNAHLRLHQGVKPFKCGECSRTFRQSAHLTAHFKAKHTDERPFECSHCGKGFISSTVLRVHSRIHTGETSYVCELCGAGYVDSHGLRRHKGRLCAPSAKESASKDTEK